MTKSKFYLIALVTAMLLSVVLASSSSFAQDFLCQPNGSDYQRTLNTVERAQEQQRESVELNRSIQSSIDRSTELSHEAATRIDRSKEYNRQINNYIDDSKGSISKAKDYLKRNAELFDRVERESRERQSNYQETQDAAQPVSDGGSGSSNRSSDSSIER